MPGETDATLLSRLRAAVKRGEGTDGDEILSLCDRLERAGRAAGIEAHSLEHTAQAVKTLARAMHADGVLEAHFAAGPVQSMKVLPRMQEPIESFAPPLALSPEERAAEEQSLLYAHTGGARKTR